MNQLLADAIVKVDYLLEQKNIHKLEQNKSLRAFQNIMGQLLPVQDIPVNLDLLDSICSIHENRPTNLYGYYQLASSKESVITREFIQININRGRNNRVFYAICLYMQNPYNVHRCLFKLLLENFRQIFSF